MTPASKTIVVAAGQIQARLMNEASATLADLEAAITQAAKRRVDLLVLPECAYPAYLLGSVASYRAGDHMAGDAFVGWLRERAKRHRMHIICGIVEDTSATLSNSAVLMDDRGREVGRSRKQFLWNVDRDWFEPGEVLCAFDTRIGRIGTAICAETRIPEILATLAADGAELIAVPTCWVNHARHPGQYANPQVEFMMEARAREFGIPFVCADKWGLELGAVGYVGRSRIIRAGGLLAVEAPPDADAVIAAEIRLSAPAKVSASDEQRARLLSSRPAKRPEDKPGRTIKVAAVPTVVVEDDWAGGRTDLFFGRMRDQGVRLLVANICASTWAAERWAQSAGEFGIFAVGFPARADVFSVGPARVGCVAGEEVRSFVVSRVHALDGAELLLCFDVGDDGSILRTRALENRVFVAGVGRGSAVIVGPDGGILVQAREDHPTAIVAEIDLAETANKLVAPRTDIFEERRPDSYRF